MVNMYIKYLKYYPFLYFMHMLVKSVLKVDPNTSNIYFCSKFIQNVVKKKILNMRHHTHNKTLLHALNTLNYIYIHDRSSPFDERAWKDRNLLVLVEY